MLAFIKRRWVLLSCVAALIGFTPLKFLYVCEMSGCFSVNLDEGTFYIVHRADLEHSEKASTFQLAFRAPQFGGSPDFAWTDNWKLIEIPVWLLLAAPIGWLVIRELRWRERRAKSN